jgi:peptide/nickel transport system ATP-binding protein
MSLLDVRDLDVRFATPDGEVHAVRDLSFTLDKGETLGIVGESGSGKSQSVLSLLGLLAENGTVGGSASFEGRDLLRLPEAELRAIRGRRISMIFQDPMTSLNPYLTIADQMTQVVREHERSSQKAARARCLDMLEAVKIPEAAARLDRYPHELSGGMRQRVMIASSLLLNPDVLIADEPTTALDVTVQAQILDLMRDLNARFGTAIILITHDLGVVAGLCERLLVMHEGELKERGEVRDIFYRPEHPYTRALLKAVPRLDEDRAERLVSGRTEGAGRPDHKAAREGGAQPTLLSVEGLEVRFPVPGEGWLGRKRSLRAVDGVDLTLQWGETLGVVGESGCGKSTLARAILKLVPATAGRVCLLGRDLYEMDRKALRGMRREFQVIFQDPLASLNPRMTVGDIVSEPLWTHRPELDKAGVRQQVVEVLQRVGLSGAELNRYPHEFSGGQCQRIGIARALVLKPKVIVCDEPVSALDVSIQAQIINLLVDLQVELGLSLIFIAHDLAVVRHISDRVLVMYLGSVMEVSSREDLYRRPRHPYTRALISAVPIPDPDKERSRERELLFGDLPSPMDPPSGCRFRTRCRFAQERCRREVPELRQVGPGWVACHFAESLTSSDAGASA